MRLQHPEAAGQKCEVGGNGGEDILGVVHQVDLVHDQDHMRYSQQGRDGQVPTRLLDNTLAGVHQQHDDISG